MFSNSVILFRFLFSIALLVMVDIYFYQAVRKITAAWPYKKKRRVDFIYWGLTATIVLLTIFNVITYQNPILPRTVSLYIFCFLMVVFISKLIGSLPLIIEDVIRLFRMLGLFFTKGTRGFEQRKGITRGKFISQMALGLAAVPFSSMVFGMVKTAFDFKLQRVKIPIPNLPDAFSGFKIVQISDIHSGSFINSSHFENAVSLIGRQNADMIVFTGDLVNDRATEAEPFAAIWQKLKAPHGVYSVLGNHDYGDYVLWENDELKRQNLDRLCALHGEMGWTLLRNEHRIIERNGEKIGLLGVENWGSAMRFPKKGDVSKAREGMPELPVNILLSHDPSHWDSKVFNENPEISLMLSGHTHGFQFGIEIPGFKWSPSQYVYPQWAGLYTRNNRHLYVNRGLGFLGYLGRIGINPEITVLELVKA
jgi:predicted MPP superfamily phosphohydrolase